MAEEKSETKFVSFSGQMLGFFPSLSTGLIKGYFLTNLNIQGTSCLWIPKTVKSESIKL